jgi:hypothetical protein
MHARPAFAAMAIVMASVAAPAAARSSQPPPDTICTVLSSADRFKGTTVTVRALATSEGKVTRLADPQCQGTIQLSIDDNDSHKRDLSAFRRAVTSRSGRIDATVFGRFSGNGTPEAPYAIDVYSVKDVEERPVADGG